MPKITLTDFLDIVSKTGTSKTVTVSKVKNKENYKPATDFYKKIRDRIIDFHLKKEAPPYLLDLTYVSDPKKFQHFQAVANGYVKWLANNKLQWCNPPAGTYTYQSFEIGIKPELGLLIEDKKYLIKLYFKAEEVSKLRGDIVLHFMETTLRKHSPDACMAMLDVRRSKLITYTGKTKNINATVVAELAYIDAVWNLL